jgi:hypothetical protein
MHTKLTAVSIAACLTVAGVARAHEGHDHKVMGKVAAVTPAQIEVETADGKKVTAALTAETKYSRDKAAATHTDVKVGERVVIVVVEEKGVQRAKQVLLGTAREKKPQPRAHEHD